MNAAAIRANRPATSYACMYGDTDTVTHLVHNVRGIDGLCAYHSDAYGYPQYLTPVFPPKVSQGRTSTVTMAGITETAVIKINTDKIACGWCWKGATYAVTLDSSDWTDLACKEHAHEWFAPHFPQIG